MPQHAQTMPRHGDVYQPDLFLAIRFLDSYVILLPGSYKKELVGTFYLSSNLATLAIFIFFEFIKTFEKDCS